MSVLILTYGHSHEQPRRKSYLFRCHTRCVTIITSRPTLKLDNHAAVKRRQNPAQGASPGCLSGNKSPERAAESLPQTCGNIVVHLIFSTKSRRPLIEPELRADLFSYLGGIIREMRGTALIINGTSDHVHVLARIRPVHSPAEVARVIKTNSSRWIHKKGRAEFSWQAG